MNLLIILAGGLLCGFLGAFAGSQGTSKNWRRMGITLILTVSALLIVKSWWCLIILSMFGVFSLGHGVPDDDFPENLYSDSGSRIGFFWTMLFRRYFNRAKAHFFADVAMRGTKGVLFSIILVILPVLKGNWVVYLLAVLAILLSETIISWRGIGYKLITIKNKVYVLCNSDIINYTILGCAVLGVITL